MEIKLESSKITTANIKIIIICNKAAACVHRIHIQNKVIIWLIIIINKMIININIKTVVIIKGGTPWQIARKFTKMNSCAILLIITTTWIHCYYLLSSSENKEPRIIVISWGKNMALKDSSLKIWFTIWIRRTMLIISPPIQKKSNYLS